MTPIVFTNIPQGGIKVVSSETKTSHKMVKQNMSFVLALSGFAIIQFIEGAKILFYGMKSSDFAPMTQVQLFVKLTAILQRGLESRNMDSLDELFVTREDMYLLKGFLEIRMSHCEKERDDRDPAFNADTYIGQKLLLLDIRELLLGEIIEEIVKQSKSHHDE